MVCLRLGHGGELERVLHSEPRESIPRGSAGLSLGHAKCDMPFRYTVADAERTGRDQSGLEVTLGAVTVKIVFKAPEVFTE